MNENRLKKLIAGFYNGTCTGDEEKELRAYFTGDDILPGYEAEREIFAFYAANVKTPEPDPDFESRILAAVDRVEADHNRKIFRRIVLPALSAAAGLLIIAGTYFFLTGQKRTADTFTDPQLAYAETVRILYDVSARMNSARRSLEPVSKISTVRERTLSSFSRPAGVVGKNLRSLGHLKNSTGTNDTAENEK